MFKIIRRLLRISDRLMTALLVPLLFLFLLQWNYMLFHIFGLTLN